MATAAYQKDIRVSTDNGANWHELCATSAGLEVTTATADATTFKSAGDMAREYTLRDWSMTASVLLSSTNDDAFNACRSANQNRTKILVQYLPNGASQLRRRSGYGDCREPFVFGWRWRPRNY